MISLVFLATAASVPTVVGAIDPAPGFEAAAVPDAVLATQRGGVRLPNGIDLALTVQTQTAVNGSVVLQTVYTLDKGPANLIVYAPAKGAAAPAAGQQAPVAAAPMTPIVSYDPRTGLSVTQGYSGMPVTVAGGAQGGSSRVPEGLVVLDTATPHDTAAGVISLQTDGPLKTVTLSGDDVSIAHFAGAAFGSAIANSGSDRAIDTVTGISIDLRNAGPDVLGSALLRVEAVALEAVGSRM